MMKYKGISLKDKKRFIEIERTQVLDQTPHIHSYNYAQVFYEKDLNQAFINFLDKLDKQIHLYQKENFNKKEIVKHLKNSFWDLKWGEIIS